MDIASQEPSSGYQPRGLAWDPERPDVLTLLADSHHTHTRPIYQGSNHCFLVTLDGGSEGKSLAIYKPARGEYPLYDFPQGSLYQRELASFLLDRLLGWKLIPPTVESSGRHGVGSLQLYIESEDEGGLELEDLQRLTLLDAVLNNADRKPEHVLLALDGRLWAIDHGLTFHAQPKLRTILWHFAGSRIPPELHSDLRRLARSLRRSQEGDRIRDLLTGVEWRALLARLDGIVEKGEFPNPRYKPVPYRW